MKLKEYKYKINGMRYKVGVGELIGNNIHVEVNGTPYEVELDSETTPVAVSAVRPIKRPSAAPRTETGEKVIAKPVAPSSGAAMVKSPLPGTIMSLKVSVGDTVSAGATVCILEAMKMENDIHTTHGGTVKRILVNPGDTVLEGSDLMEIG